MIKDLNVQMLLRIDIIGLEKINTNILDQSATISSCQDLKIFLFITPRSGDKIKRIVRTKEKTIIESCSMAYIKVKLAALPRDWDFSFYLKYNDNTKKLREQGEIYAHIVGANISCIQVCNDRNIPIVILKPSCIRTVNKFDKKGCYTVNPDTHGFAAIA